jgi:4-methylaminobutanoate oxidase (formaldehyde-forming)
MLIQTLALKCKNPIPWTTGDVPDDFQFHLFYDAWDHPAQHMEHAIARVLALNEAGVKQMINGPKSFTPDGNFILGLAPDCANMFVGTGFNAFGIASGGGAGRVLAQWVIGGEAPMELTVMDIRRFFDLHRHRNWVCERTLDAYGKHYTTSFPHEKYVRGGVRAHCTHN